MSWLKSVFEFLKYVARREGTTMPGLINLSFVVLLTVGIFTVGFVEGLESVVRAFRGEDGQAFPPTVIVIGDMVVMLLCVSILIAADRLGGSGD